MNINIFVVIKITPHLLLELNLEYSFKNHTSGIVSSPSLAFQLTGIYAWQVRPGAWEKGLFEGKKTDL